MLQFRSGSSQIRKLVFAFACSLETLLTHYSLIFAVQKMHVTLELCPSIPPQKDEGNFSAAFFKYQEYLDSVDEQRRSDIFRQRASERLAHEKAEKDEAQKRLDEKEKAEKEKAGKEKGLAATISAGGPASNGVSSVASAAVASSAPSFLVMPSAGGAFSFSGGGNSVGSSAASSSGISNAASSSSLGSGFPFSASSAPSSVQTFSLTSATSFNSSGVLTGFISGFVKGSASSISSASFVSKPQGSHVAQPPVTTTAASSQPRAEAHISGEVHSPTCSILHSDLQSSRSNHCLQKPLTSSAGNTANMFLAQSFQGSNIADAWKNPSLAVAGAPLVSFGFSQASSHKTPSFTRAPTKAFEQGGFGGFAATDSAGFGFAVAAQQMGSPSFGSGQGKVASPAPPTGQGFGGQGFGGQTFSGQGMFSPAHPNLVPNSGRIARQDGDDSD